MLDDSQQPASKETELVVKCRQIQKQAQASVIANHAWQHSAHGTGFNILTFNPTGADHTR